MSERVRILLGGQLSTETREHPQSCSILLNAVMHQTLSCSATQTDFSKDEYREFLATCAKPNGTHAQCLQDLCRPGGQIQPLPGMQ